ncbi:MAG: enoyl-CoA hydratase/isomerase family protein [Deltaproteobacteria bacterium]|nr:enoyl-CoA hydratase/isomerase family protein [Deltaproteobacteria bacterium]
MAYPQGGPLRVEHRGTALVLTLDRVERHNALSRQLIEELGQAARAAATDPSVRAIVLTGAGDKAFCAGADLKERQALSKDQVREIVRLYRTEFGALDRSPKPVIAALNGVALGGGLELALMADLRVAAAGVQIGLPETSLAIIPGAGGTQKLPRIVGEARAKEMILLGRRLSADEALAWGLVNRVAPAGTPVLDDALAFIEPILRGAPVAQAAALEAIDAGLDADLATGMQLEILAYDRVLVSEDRDEALRAFGEKRPPNYQGK